MLHRITNFETPKTNKYQSFKLKKKAFQKKKKEKKEKEKITQYQQIAHDSNSLASLQLEVLANHFATRYRRLDCGGDVQRVQSDFHLCSTVPKEIDFVSLKIVTIKKIKKAYLFKQVTG